MAELLRAVRAAAGPIVVREFRAECADRPPSDEKEKLPPASGNRILDTLIRFPLCGRLYPTSWRIGDGTAVPKIR
jgi:hypothetical protein